MTGITGFSHVALTVRDVSRSKAFYTDVFGLQPWIDTDDVFIGMHSGTQMVIGLRRHEGALDDEFTHLRTGLDHIAFSAASKDDLNAWQQRFDDLGVSHSPVEKSEVGWHLNFRDPDNIPLEFFVLEMES